MSDDQVQVEVEEYIEASPSEAFEYVTDPERRSFGNGGRIEFGDELERDAPSRVAWEVTTADGETRRLGTVEIAISPSGTGSRVRVTHRVGSPVAALAGSASRIELALAA